MTDLDYNGTPDFSRKRRLVEPVVEKAPPPDETDPLQDDVKQLYEDLGRAYLKGNVLQKGLAAMTPAQFIPIGISETAVSAAAKRLDADATKQGVIIPFSVYRQAVDILAAEQWRIKRFYDITDLPAETTSSHNSISNHINNPNSEGSDLITQFLTGNGAAGAALMAFAVMPFMQDGFQALTSAESASKATFGAKVIFAVALLLELGLKAKAIIDLIKGLDQPADVADIVSELDSNPQARIAALKEGGIDYDKLKKSNEVTDSNTIIEYVNRYITGHTDDGVLTYDHWIAYSNVTARQNLLRGALDDATMYSKDFSKEFKQYEPDDSGGGGVISTSIKKNRQIKMPDILGSHLFELSTSSHQGYDDTLNAFLYQVTDSDLCCIVEIFGPIETEVLLVIAKILRIASMDLKSTILNIMNATFAFLASMGYMAVYQLITKMNELHDKLVKNLLKSFQTALPYFEHCPSLKDIGVAIGMSLTNIKKKIESLLADILTMLDQLNMPLEGSWNISADRRYLLTAAVVMETIASRLDAANACATVDTNINVHLKAPDPAQEAKEQAAHEVIHSILDNSPPSIQVSNKDIEKYFPGLVPSTSPTFGFQIGPASLFPEVNNRGQRVGCGGSTVEQSKIASTEFISALKEAFGT